MKPFWLPWNPLSQSRRGGVISFEENKTSCQEKIYKMKKGGKRGIQPTITGLFIIIKMKKKIQKQNVCARINQKFEAPVADLSFLFALTCLLNFFCGVSFSRHCMSFSSSCLSFIHVWVVSVRRHCVLPVHTSSTACPNPLVPLFLCKMKKILTSLSPDAFLSR